MAQDLLDNIPSLSTEVKVSNVTTDSNQPRPNTATSAREIIDSLTEQIRTTA